MVPSNARWALDMERRLRLLTVAGFPLGWYPMASQNDGRATGVKIIVVRPSLPEIQASLLIAQRVVAHLVFLRAGTRIPQAAISSAMQKPASVWASMVTMTCGP